MTKENTRPKPFVGMLAFTEDLLYWFKINKLDEKLIYHADVYHPDGTEYGTKVFFELKYYLLPGEEGCPKIPKPLIVNPEEGDIVHVRSSGKWFSGVVHRRSGGTIIAQIKWHSGVFCFATDDLDSILVNKQKALESSSFDISRYPHKCRECGQPAFVGMSIECTNPSCRHYGI